MLNVLHKGPSFRHVLQPSVAVSLLLPFGVKGRFDGWFTGGPESFGHNRIVLHPFFERGRRVISSKNPVRYFFVLDCLVNDGLGGLPGAGPFSVDGAISNGLCYELPHQLAVFLPLVDCFLTALVEIQPEEALDIRDACPHQGILCFDERAPRKFPFASINEQPRCACVSERLPCAGDVRIFTLRLRRCDECWRETLYEITLGQGLTDLLCFKLHIEGGRPGGKATINVVANFMNYGFRTLLEINEPSVAIFHAVISWISGHMTAVLAPYPAGGLMILSATFNDSS